MTSEIVDHADGSRTIYTPLPVRMVKPNDPELLLNLYLSTAMMAGLSKRRLRNGIRYYLGRYQYSQDTLDMVAGLAGREVLSSPRRSWIRRLSDTTIFRIGATMLFAGSCVVAAAVASAFVW